MSRWAVVARWGCAIALAGSGLAAWPAERPHIVYILADDLGWKDVGYHGGAVKTPHLDRLSQQGARLERFYVMPYSTGTRAALLTGRYPMRYGLQTLSIQPWNSYGLPADERLLPEALKDAGYRTAALGEWRLGHARREWWPTQRGFDSFFGSLNALGDRVKKTDAEGRKDWRRNNSPVQQEGHAIALLAREAVALIRSHDSRRPLFLYVSLPGPAAPWQAPREYLERYADVGEQERQRYYAMISMMDDAVGMIADALEARGMWQDAVLVFHSDNGGAVKHKFATGDGDVQRNVADNGPFRNGGGGLHEGSVRVAAFAVAPGRIAAGVTTERLHVTDLYPTLLKLAGAALDPERQVKPIDGLDAWEAVSQGKPGPRNEVVVAVEEFRGALVAGNWKIIAYSALPSRYELYNVHDDPSEEDNRADREPQKAQELLARLNELAWEMAPSLYLEDLARAHRNDAPMVWGENALRP
jgi:arylsulfatase A-like enzyme